MDYEYNKKLFVKEQITAIEQAIKLKIDKEIFDILTSTRFDRHTSYLGFELELIESPVFNSAQMFRILEGVENGLTIEQIKFYTKLKPNGKPMYREGQMNEIILGYQDKMSEEQINILAQCKNNAPVFEAGEMNSIRHFIKDADKKQIKCLKDNVEKELSFAKLSVISHTDIDAENMRILSSLYDFGCEPYFIQNIIERRFNYEKIKDIKHLVKCSSGLGLSPNLFLSVTSRNWTNWTIEEKQRELAGEILKEFNNGKDKEIEDAIFLCLKQKANPEIIYYVADPVYEFDGKDIREILYGHLAGLDLNMIDNIVQNRESGEDLSDAINITVKAIRPNIDEIGLNWLKDIEEECL